MKDSFRDSVTTQLMDLARKALLNAQVGDKEVEVLMLFYDETNRARRDKVPKFHIYGRVCDGKHEDSWAINMNKADRALLTLKKAELIQDVDPTQLGAEAARYVGEAAHMYKLTATGLELLQGIHPSLALQFRGWVSVLPPWLVICGTIAGGISALWGMIRLAITLGSWG